MQLKEAREEKRLTPEDLARRSGVSPETLARIESGEAQYPERSAIQALSTALEVDPSQIDEFRPALGLAALGETRSGEAARTGASE